jgi:acetate kinase
MAVLRVHRRDPAGVAPEIAGGRVVVAHLGSGASMCAMHNGRSVGSSMGFTALDGLLMGTRPGNMDPGIVLYLLQQEGMSAKQIEDLLYKRSGLLGLSGIGNDMRVLLASEEPRARLAIDHFVYRISRELGALAAVLGGLDALVFTAGIGENSAASGNSSANRRMAGHRPRSGSQRKLAARASAAPAARPRRGWCRPTRS